MSVECYDDDCMTCSECMWCAKWTPNPTLCEECKELELDDLYRG